MLISNKQNETKNINNKQIKRCVTSTTNHYHKVSTLNSHYPTFIFINDNISTNNNIHQFIFQIMRYINHYEQNSNHQMTAQIKNEPKQSLQIIFTITNNNWYWSHNPYLISRTL